MPGSPLDNVDVDALDEWAVGSNGLSKLRDAFDKWLVRGTNPRAGDPYTTATEAYKYYISMAEQVLGEEHPYLQYFRRRVSDKTEAYLSTTRALISDWSERWGARWGMAPHQLDLDLSLRSVVAYDTVRLARLPLWGQILISLLDNGWSEDGLTQIKYKFTDGGRGEMELPTSLASDILDCNLTTFEALKDRRVPWNYLFIEPTSEYEDWLGTEGIDTIYRLWHDDLGLSPAAKQEMGCLGWIVLDANAMFFRIPIFNNTNRSSIIIVPAYEPWKYENQLTASFKDWVMPQFEHETQHLIDWRAFGSDSYLGLVIPEARAFSAELDTMRRAGSAPKSIRKIENALEPYLAAIGGSPVQFGAFHVERHYFSSCIDLTVDVAQQGFADQLVKVLKADSEETDEQS